MLLQSYVNTVAGKCGRHTRSSSYIKRRYGPRHAWVYRNGCIPRVMHRTSFIHLPLDFSVCMCISVCVSSPVCTHLHHHDSCSYIHIHVAPISCALIKPVSPDSPIWNVWFRCIKVCSVKRANVEISWRTFKSIKSQLSQHVCILWSLNNLEFSIYICW